MSRRNYIHTMDALIGKPYFNAAGEILDPNTGLAVDTPIFATEMPRRDEAIAPLPTPPLSGLTDEEQDLERIKLENARREAEALRIANLSEAEKAERLRRIALMQEARAKKEAEKQAKKDAEAKAKLEAETKKTVQAEVKAQIKKFNPPPIILGGGGGGGGAMSVPEKKSPPTTIQEAKPSFLKKNFIPLLLVGVAIFVFIKKPIK